MFYLVDMSTDTCPKYKRKDERERERQKGGGGQWRGALLILPYLSLFVFKVQVIEE